MNHSPGSKTLSPIILIDDDLDDLELMTDELSALPCENEIFGFQLPHEALAFFKEMLLKPYFITCDVHMPKMDGYELREKMLDEVTHLGSAPFYILSTFITDRERALGDTLLVHGFYSKAFTKQGMRENLQDMIERAERIGTLNLKI